MLVGLVFFVQIIRPLQVILWFLVPKLHAGGRLFLIMSFWFHLMNFIIFQMNILILYHMDHSAHV